MSDKREIKRVAFMTAQRAGKTVRMLRDVIDKCFPDPVEIEVYEAPRIKDLESKLAIAKEALDKCLPVVESAYWDDHSAGCFPGSGYSHKCYSKLPFSWRESNQFSSWINNLRNELALKRIEDE